MAIFRYLLLVVFVRLGIIAVAARSSHDVCQPAACWTDGPLIKSPFRLKGRQPECCGYPEFELSCNDQNQTLLQLLPSSVKLQVIQIDYKSQQIQASALDGISCLPRQLLNLDFSASPFRFRKSYYDDFYNCSPPKRENLGGWVPCLSSVSGYHVYTMAAGVDVTSYPWTSCTKIGTIASVLFYYHYSDNSSNIEIPWLKPADSKNCDAEDTFCSSEIVCKHNGEDAIKKLKLAGIILGCFFLLLAVVAFFYLYMSNKVEKENQAKIEKFLEDYKALRPTRYSYADIKHITNQFREKLGEGGYGTVYKGILSHEISVAIKVLNNFKENGEDFINEVGTIGKIHHVNVVRLVGFCADGFIRALVYEFLPNDSLEKHIFSDNSKNHHLGWERLQHIASGIAKGIEYLHQGCDQRILHFDIKPHNILLDHNFNPKIFDFGLAKLCSKEQSAVSMTAARGTMGYIAPEVLSRNFGKVSYKSDVYSYGMLLLEMVGGRKNNDVKAENVSQMYFPEWIYNRLEQGEELRIRIEEDGDDKIVKKLTIVGLWCIQWNPADRPSMKVVNQMLEDDADNLTVPPNPFSTTNASKSGTGAHFQQELTVIPEQE